MTSSAERAPHCWSRGVAAALGSALVLQGAIFAARGHFLAPPDYLQHSALAETIVRRVPALYSPTLEVFAERTLHVDTKGDWTGPVVFVADGRCRKALAQRRHAEELRARCGAQPPAFTRFREETAARNRRGEWTYVNY